MPLSRHFRAVRDARLDVERCQAGILFENLWRGHTGRQEVENEGYPDARAFDTRFAKADTWIDRDSVQQFFLCWHKFQRFLTTDSADCTDFFFSSCHPA